MRDGPVGNMESMTEISERYKRLSDAFAKKIENVSDDQWSAQTPCEEWNARDLVGHVVNTQGMFLGFIGEELGDIPSATDDPAGAWRAASARVQATLEDPEKAPKEFEGGLGKSTFEAAVDRFLNTDLVVHGWDLARATGQDDTMAGEDIERIKQYMEPLADKMRGPNAFAEEVDVADDASAQDKLLAFLGRQP